MHAVQSHHRAIMRNVELIVASGAKFPCLTQQYTALHRAHIAAGSTQLSQAASHVACTCPCAICLLRPTPQ